MGDCELEALDALDTLYRRIKTTLEVPDTVVLLLSLDGELKTFWASGVDVGRFPGVGQPLPAKNPRFRLLGRDDLKTIGKLKWESTIIEILENRL